MTSHHLVAFDDGWSFWRTMCLRGAGFPAIDAYGLAAPGATAAVDQLFAVEERIAIARTAALAALERALESTPKEQRKAYTSAIVRIRAGRPPGPREAIDDVRTAVAALTVVEGELADARAAVARAVEEGSLRASERLRAAAQDPRFREAVMWQNSTFLRVGVEALLRRPPGATDSKARQYEMTLASYLQRYSVKNDTIGFFGPVGWGSFGEQTRLVPGPSLLASRTVYFEYWGIDRLAMTLAEDPWLRLYLAPRRLPTVWVEGTTLHHPIARTSELPESYARLLAACDGERPAYVIAQELCADEALELSGVDEVYELLGELIEKHLVTWTIEIPTDSARPDQALRELLERADEAGQRGLAALDELEAHRQAVVAACGDDAALGHALGELDACFTRLTETAATRNAGKTYGSRTLVYEDCRRDLELTLGPEQIALLGPALAPVLLSARWFTYTIAERYREVLVDAYRALCVEHEATAIDYLRFWQRVSSHFESEGRVAPPIVREVVAELHQRWMTLLGGPFTGRAVSHAATDLHAAATTAFAAPHPGWPTARHHSPDVIAAAQSAAAMRTGDVTYVLGELHVGINTMGVPLFLAQHPDPEQVVAWMMEDLPEPQILPVTTREQVNRAYSAFRRPIDLDLEMGAARSSRPREDVVCVGGLVVEDIEGRLCVRTQEGRTFDAMVFFDRFLQMLAATHFSLLGPLAHTPRITIDKLVISRERWTFAPDDLPFCKLDASAERFTETRRWARTHGLPRLLFYKVPEERKPCFLDLDSPTFVDTFLRIVRKASKVHVSEMLPVIDDCWLADAEGRTYTSELRIVTLDPEPWRPSTP